MAKKKIRRRRRNSFTIPLAPVIPIASIGITHAQELMRGVEPTLVLDRLGTELVGYSYRYGGFSWEGLKRGLIPILGGLLIHKVAGRLGVNRAIANAGVPFIRI